LTILSLLVASTRPSGQPDPDLTPAGVKAAQDRKTWDEDDIPLGQLRRDRRPDLSLASTQTRIHDEVRSETSAVSSSGSSGYSPEVLPFPLTVSPFVPATATDAGEDDDEVEVDRDTEMRTTELSNGPSDEIEEDVGDEDRLLPDSELGPRNENRKSLFAKNSSGGHRWCSKCDAWKPDRCHHCRYCKQCTLKSESTIF
jgi:hypothetical protein